MKNTLDTNVFIYGTVSSSCAKLIHENYDNSSNIILFSVYEEYYSKLLKLNSILTTLYEETAKVPDILKLLDSQLYTKLDMIFPQIFKALRNLIINKIRNDKKQFEIILEEILEDIRYILKISPRYLYPLSSEEYEKVKQEKLVKTCIRKLKGFMKNENDRIHVALCNRFICLNLKSKDKLKFYTLDKKDFIKKGSKHKIQSLIDNFEIELLDLNVENIVIDI